MSISMAKFATLLVCRELAVRSVVIPGAVQGPWLFRFPKPCRASLRLRVPGTIDVDEFQGLDRLVRKTLREQGVEIEELRPGDLFQPGILEVPSFPKADFLWSSVRAPVVSDRIKTLFEGNEVTGVALCPVVIEKVGKSSSAAIPQIPTSGEPEEILQEVQWGEYQGDVGYFEMVVTGKSLRPPEVSTIEICERCHRETLDQNHYRVEMRKEFWLGEDVFYFGESLWIIVTERVKDLLDHAKATNIEFISV